MSVYHIPCASPVEPGRLDVANASHVVQTLRTSVQLLKDKRFDAVVTAPVQKSVINDSGLSFTGHTEFFSEQFGCEDVVMLLVNDGLRVALATTHLPLREVPDAITQESLLRKLEIIHNELMRLYGITQPRIAMLGLNPHAGEGGHLGREEIETIHAGTRGSAAPRHRCNCTYPGGYGFYVQTGARCRRCVGYVS